MERAWSITPPIPAIRSSSRTGTATVPDGCIQAQPGVHNHYPTWSPDGRSIYFVSGIPPTEEMDIWRIPVSTSDAAATPERITSHNAWVAYPAWLDARTLIYAATAEDGAGQWLYAIDVEHRIPHRVSSGIAEQYLSVAVSNSRTAACGRRHRHTHGQPVDGPHLGWRSDGGAVTRVEAPNTRAIGPRFAPGYLAFLSSKGAKRTVEARKRGGPGTVERRRGRGRGSTGHFSRRSVDLLFLPQTWDDGLVHHECQRHERPNAGWTPSTCAAPPPGPLMASGWPSPQIREKAPVCSRFP